MPATQPGYTESSCVASGSQEVTTGKSSAQESSTRTHHTPPSGTPHLYSYGHKGVDKALLRPAKRVKFLGEEGKGVRRVHVRPFR